MPAQRTDTKGREDMAREETQGRGRLVEGRGETRVRRRHVYVVEASSECDKPAEVLVTTPVLHTMQPLTYNVCLSLGLESGQIPEGRRFPLVQLREGAVQGARVGWS